MSSLMASGASAAIHVYVSATTSKFSSWTKSWISAALFTAEHVLSRPNFMFLRPTDCAALTAVVDLKGPGLLSTPPHSSRSVTSTAPGD